MNKTDKAIEEASRTNKLRLASLLLTAVPTNVFSLVHLVDLDLTRNQLSRLPGSLSNLRSLEHLRLPWNSFEAIPSTVLMLPKLRTLDVSFNRLRAIGKGFGALASLRELTANDNPIREVCADLGTCGELRVVNLKYCEITELPREVMRLQNLRGIDLAGNAMVTPPADVCLDGARAIRKWLAAREAAPPPAADAGRETGHSEQASHASHTSHTARSEREEAARDNGQVSRGSAPAAVAPYEPVDVAGIEARVEKLMQEYRDRRGIPPGSAAADAAAIAASATAAAAAAEAELAHANNARSRRREAEQQQPPRQRPSTYADTLEQGEAGSSGNTQPPPPPPRTNERPADTMSCAERVAAEEEEDQRQMQLRQQQRQQQLELQQQQLQQIQAERHGAAAAAVVGRNHRGHGGGGGGGVDDVSSHVRGFEGFTGRSRRGNNPSTASAPRIGGPRAGRLNARQSPQSAAGLRNDPALAAPSSRHFVTPTTSSPSNPSSASATSTSSSASSHSPSPPSASTSLQHHNGHRGARQSTRVGGSAGQLVRAAPGPLRHRGSAPVLDFRRRPAQSSAPRVTSRSSMPVVVAATGNTTGTTTSSSRRSHANTADDEDEDDMARVHSILREFGREDLMGYLDPTTSAAGGGSTGAAVDGSRGYVLADGTVIPPDLDDPDPWGTGRRRDGRRRDGRRRRDRRYSGESDDDLSDSYDGGDARGGGGADDTAAVVEPPELPAGVEVPPHFLCPILRDLMMDPVVATDGHTYERHAIRTWLKGHTKSPMTGKTMRSRDLTPNFTLRSMINDFIDKAMAEGEKA